MGEDFQLHAGSGEPIQLGHRRRVLSGAWGRPLFDRKRTRRRRRPLEVIDLPGLHEFAREHKVISRDIVVLRSGSLEREVEGRRRRHRLRRGHLHSYGAGEMHGGHVRPIHRELRDDVIVGVAPRKD